MRTKLRTKLLIASILTIFVLLSIINHRSFLIKKISSLTHIKIGDLKPQQPADQDRVVSDPKISSTKVSETKDTNNDKAKKRKVRYGADMLWYGHFFDDHDLLNFKKSFSDLDLDIARFDIYWGKLEPQKDIYDWKTLDELLGSVEKDTPVLLTVYSANEWGSKYNECRKVMAETMGINISRAYNRPPSSLPSDMDQYMEFLETLVEKYGDRVKYWQIENEVYSYGRYSAPGCENLNTFWIGSKEEYLELLKNSYSRIKSIDNDSTVLVSSFAFGANFTNVMNSNSANFKNFDKWAEYVLDNGKNYFDILDLHLYGCTESDPEKIGYVKSKMEKFKYNKPLWVTESGEIDTECYTQNNEFAKSFFSKEEMMLQSIDLIKRHVLAFANGVDVVFRLRLNTLKTDKYTSNWPHMGLVFDETRKNPAFFTFDILNSKINDFSSVEIIEDGIYKFNGTGNDGPIFVLWNKNNGQKIIDLSKYVPNKALITYIVAELDSSNNPIYKKSQSVDPKAIPISEIPIFIQSN